MIALITQGVGLGFAAGVTPGPLQSYLIATTLSRGWRNALLVVLSPLITDVPIALMVLVVLGQFSAGVLSLIQVAGGLLVLWIARGTWQQYRGESQAQTIGAHKTARDTLAKGVLMNFLSPGPYIFWTTVTGPLLLEGLRQSVWHGAAFIASFYGVFLGMMTAIVLMLDRLGRWNQHVMRRVLLLAIVVLAVMGVTLLVNGMIGLIGAS